MASRIHRWLNGCRRFIFFMTAGRQMSREMCETRCWLWTFRIATRRSSIRSLILEERPRRKRYRRRTSRSPCFMVSRTQQSSGADHPSLSYEYILRNFASRCMLWSATISVQTTLTVVRRCKTIRNSSYDDDDDEYEIAANLHAQI